MSECRHLGRGPDFYDYDDNDAPDNGCGYGDGEAGDGDFGGGWGYDGYVGYDVDDDFGAVTDRSSPCPAYLVKVAE